MSGLKPWEKMNVVLDTPAEGVSLWEEKAKIEYIQKAIRAPWGNTATLRVAEALNVPLPEKTRHSLERRNTLVERARHLTVIADSLQSMSNTELNPHTKYQTLILKAIAGLNKRSLTGDPMALTSFEEYANLIEGNISEFLSKYAVHDSNNKRVSLETLLPNDILDPQAEINAPLSDGEKDIMVVAATVGLLPGIVPDMVSRIAPGILRSLLGFANKELSNMHGIINPKTIFPPLIMTMKKLKQRFPLLGEHAFSTVMASSWYHRQVEQVFANQVKIFSLRN